jgi:DNA-binding transcriptional regulator YhcF (GntR family)
MANNLVLKQQGVINLVDLKVKKVTPIMIRTEAKSLGLTFETLNRAWTNFVQFGVVDLRTKDGRKFLNHKQKQQVNTNNKKYFKGLKVQSLTQQQKANMVREYTFTNIKAVDLFRKYSMSPTQFYEIIRKLNVAGTVDGKGILNPKKYAKLDIKEVIRYSKKPHLFRKSDLLHKKHLQRVIDILDKYL